MLFDACASRTSGLAAYAAFTAAVLALARNMCRARQVKYAVFCALSVVLRPRIHRCLSCLHRWLPCVQRWSRGSERGFNCDALLQHVIVQDCALEKGLSIFRTPWCYTRHLTC